jgi:DNA-binding GntR family transcriptional regulator
MLEALDGLAAYLAAERATDDQIEELRHLNNEAVGNLKKGNIRRWQERNLRFHQTLVDLVGNRRLHDTFDLLYSQLRRALLLTLPLRDEFMPSMQAHTDILVAIQNGDAESARSIAQEHRRQVRDDVIAALGKIDLPNMRY